MSGRIDAAAVRRLGLAHVPEDRHHMGLVLAFEENENSILGYQERGTLIQWPCLDIGAIRADAREKIEDYDIRPPDCRLKTANFSGGNQQKIVVAREIEQDPDVLLVGQPTRGVDIGAIEFIHRRIVEMRDRGKAILLVSVELDEIRSLSDRILVMFAGHIVGERGPEASENDLGLMMAGIATPARRRNEGRLAVRTLRGHGQSLWPGLSDCRSSQPFGPFRSRRGKAWVMLDLCGKFTCGESAVIAEHPDPVSPRSPSTSKPPAGGGRHHPAQSPRRFRQ